MNALREVKKRKREKENKGKKEPCCLWLWHENVCTSSGQTPPTHSLFLFLSFSPPHQCHSHRHRHSCHTSPQAWRWKYTVIQLARIKEGNECEWIRGEQWHSAHEGQNELKWKIIWEECHKSEAKEEPRMDDDLSLNVDRTDSDAVSLIFNRCARASFSKKGNYFRHSDKKGFEYRVLRWRDVALGGEGIFGHVPTVRVTPRWWMEIKTPQRNTDLPSAQYMSTKYFYSIPLHILFSLSVSYLLPFCLFLNVTPAHCLRWNV